MQPPLISHPTRDEATNTYSADQLTDDGDLRLAAHNRVVADRAVSLFGQTSETAKYLRAAAALHDFGKATPQFQAYVRPNEDHNCSTEETAHARLGALATWYVLGKLGAPDRDRLAGTLAVARHHQALPNAAQYTAETLAEAFETQEGVISAQLSKIDKMWPKAATELLKQTPLSGPDWSEFYSWASSDTVSSELRDVSARATLGGTTPDSSALPRKLYDRTLRFWSAITLADKSHAMDIPPEWVFDLETLDRDTIEDYIATIQKREPENELEAQLNKERERGRRQTIRGVHEWVSQPNSRIATLTLPTGLGKTFTGLTAAFELRDILCEQSSTELRRPIVYALPYTSIIEQTRAIFEDPDLWGADPEQSALTVHHYLSETVVHHDEYDGDDTAATDSDTAAFLGEAWRDGTILTTFVQLFESLAGPTNRQGLKLSSLRSSIIILDEPQALPKDWWDGIERLLDVLTEEFSARIIAMTATQPSLVRNLDTTPLLASGLQHTEEDCELCSAEDTHRTTFEPAPQETYFTQAERVRYSIDQTALSRQLGVDETHIGYESAADRVLDATGGGGSTLAICNTIQSSRALTEVLSNRPGVIHLGETIEAVFKEADLSGIDSISTEAVVDEVLARRGRSKSEPHANSPGNGSTQLNNSEDSTETYLLTLNSRYRPIDREVLIAVADRLSTSDTPFVLVSTQAIEAGVDLSFETVFRDLAPLDSIVQAAGRCNRSYEWGENGGRVIVWLLADPNEETPQNPSSKPPAYYVYEKGATDDGIPDHLRLISDVLSDVPNHQDAADAALSRDAVTAYFEQLTEKSLWSTALRSKVDDARARDLSRESLIGGVQTFDVLVAVTDADIAEIEAISDLLANDDPQGYDRLTNASGLRVSLPKSVIEESPRLARLDRRERGSDGVQVFQFLGKNDLKYDFTAGGLAPTSGSVSDRFTL